MSQDVGHRETLVADWAVVHLERSYIIPWAFG